MGSWRIQIEDKLVKFFSEYNKDFISRMKRYGCWWNSSLRYWYIEKDKINEDLRDDVEQFFALSEIKKLDDILKEKENKIEESRKIDANISIPAPEGLSYFPFQRAGVEFILNRKNVLIADEMGLGKTVQAIGYLNVVENSYPVVIVCPASLKYNWKKELTRWLVNKKRITVIEGKNMELNSADIYIVNYDIVESYVEKLNELNIKTLILDEVHYIKNYKAKRTKAVKELKAEKVIALSGTPLLNRPIELFPILERLGMTYNFWYYAKRYCNAYKDRYGWNLNGASNVDELAEELRLKVMLRREKKDVLTELPDKIRTIIPLKIDKNSNLIKAENIVRDIFKRVEDFNKEIQNIKAKLQNEKDNKELKKRLQDLKYEKANYYKVNFEKIEQYRQIVALEKLPYVLDFIESVISANGDKIVVFCHHQMIYEKIKTTLEEKGYKVAGIIGGMDAQDRQKEVERFQNDKDVKVFVGTIRACGEGITLTASSKVVFAEYDWTPARMVQAEDRVHRIGQKEVVNSYWFAVEDSIDSMFIEKIVNKMRVISAVMGDTGNEDDELFILEEKEV